ncbi:MAG TPA: radical SAM protein [Planctomycetota bacterium]|jgi:radical SAM superfamily enzyme YgiQ (UPF0313 family)|nr:radical SAM protein [Planctomycetota bacterium]
MKVVLIYAKSQAIRELAAAAFANQDKQKGELARDEIYPPLGISILGAELLELGHDVRLLDDSIRELDEVKAGMDWADVVGISSLTPNARRARELGQISRNDYKKPTILGGPHPTTNPEFFLDAGAADICVQGEGDETLPEILDAIDDPERWPDILGITFMQAGELHRTPRRPLVKDVDALPFPAYHLWDIPEYMRIMVNPGVTTITSRGCPYACTFCDAEMTPRLYRAMGAERTVDLIELILKTYNPPQIIFFDDLFTIQRKRVIALCKEIIRRDLSFEWLCESRVDTMDFEMLRWMRRAGCVKIAYGLESGSPRLLTTMKKGVTPDKVRAGSKLNRQLGMYFKFFILYGFPEELPEDHRYTEELVTETRPDSICVAMLQPIPGTELYESIKDSLLQDVAEIEFHYWHSTETFKHPTFSHAELNQERDRLLKVHANATKHWLPRLQRKFERLWTMITHPYLIGDLIDVKLRRRRHLKRVQESAWSYIYDGSRDDVALQVPNVTAD